MVTELEKKHFLKSKMTYDMWLQRYKDRTVESLMSMNTQSGLKNFKRGELVTLRKYNVITHNRRMYQL